MNDESAFLRKLRENPADDTTRLVYADWLDERGDEESRKKSQFLRLTVRLLEPKRPKSDDKQLQKLAAKLDLDWLAVVSRLKVENCGSKQAEQARSGRFSMNLFEFVCDKRWDEMIPTDDAVVRHCEKCKENVHYCDTIIEARNHAQRGHCIAVDLGIIRHEEDVTRYEYHVLGRPSAATLERERRRRSVDAVSAERELRKQRQGESAEGRD